MGAQPQFAAQNQFPSFQSQAAPQKAAPASDNPFAGANPFSGGGFVPGKVTEFKPATKKGIMEDDDDAGPVDFTAIGTQKKKKKETTQELAAKKEAEKKKAEEEANAKLSFKGKPSSFFVMDFLQGDSRDPTGQQRVPTQEQSVFIFTHYPMCARPDMMIMKLYDLYQESYQHE